VIVAWVGNLWRAGAHNLGSTAGRFQGEIQHGD
jgi:hypothetical protein